MGQSFQEEIHWLVQIISLHSWAQTWSLTGTSDQGSWKTAQNLTKQSCDCVVSDLVILCMKSALFDKLLYYLEVGLSQGGQAL